MAAARPCICCHCHGMVLGCGAIIAIQGINIDVKLTLLNKDNGASELLLGGVFFNNHLVSVYNLVSAFKIL